MKKSPNKIQVDYTIIDIYQDYSKQIIPELQAEYSLYSSIFKDFFKKASEGILVNQEVLTISAKFGGFRIRKYKPNYKNMHKKKALINWHLSKQLGKKVFFLNEERDGHIYKWQWCSRGIFRNKGSYSFIPSRQNKRNLAYLLKKYNKQQLDYPE